jgi:hypothetical protein
MDARSASKRRIASGMLLLFVPSQELRHAVMTLIQVASICRFRPRLLQADEVSEALVLRVPHVTTSIHLMWQFYLSRQQDLLSPVPPGSCSHRQNEALGAAQAGGFVNRCTKVSSLVGWSWLCSVSAYLHRFCQQRTLAIHRVGIARVTLLALLITEPNSIVMMSKVGGD